jgi:hypothetical protein
MILMMLLFFHITFLNKIKNYLIYYNIYLQNQLKIREIACANVQGHDLNNKTQTSLSCIERSDQLDVPIAKTLIFSSDVLDPTGVDKHLRCAIGKVAGVCIQARAA